MCDVPPPLGWRAHERLDARWLMMHQALGRWGDFVVKVGMQCIWVQKMHVVVVGGLGEWWAIGLGKM